MPTDLPMAIMFLVFLALFVLIGTSPVLHRLFGVVGVLLRGLGRLQGGTAGQTESGLGSEKNWQGHTLNDYEIILIRKLAMAGGKGLSRKALINDLYLKPASVDRTLTSLSAKGFVRSVRRSLFGERYYLTVAGQKYAVEQDMVPLYQLHSRGKGRQSLIR